MQNSRDLQKKKLYFWYPSMSNLSIVQLYPKNPWLPRHLATVNGTVTSVASCITAIWILTFYAFLPVYLFPSSCCDVLRIRFNFCLILLLKTAQETGNRIMLCLQNVRSVLHVLHVCMLKTQNFLLIWFVWRFHVTWRYLLWRYLLGSIMILSTKIHGYCWPSFLNSCLLNNEFCLQ